MNANFSENKNPASKEGFKEIINPYSPYIIDSGRQFYRADLIEWLKKELQSTASNDFIVIHGYRGSGKTSTLEKIVKDPAILGSGYLPVYLYSGKFKPADIGAFLLFVYEEIQEALLGAGYKSIKPDHALRPALSSSEMEDFLEKITALIAEQTKVILIFDDFEELMRKIDDQMARLIFRFFQEHILSKRMNFRLILAGRVDIYDIATQKHVGKYMDFAKRIDLGKFVDERYAVKTFIIDPVKGSVEYSPEAIQEIVKISGGNLYCQQLLCYYLIQYLNSEERNSGTPEDVHEAERLALDDRRDDFSYFWKNMQFDSQLVAAALADESITKRRGSYYFLEETALLYAIFPKDKLYKILGRLVENSYIRPIDGIRFDDYPYLIPLYGRWVQKEHPFLKTLLDNWHSIVETASLTGLGRILQMLPPEKLPIENEIIKATILLARLWSEIVESLAQRVIDRTQIHTLIQVICNILNFKIERKPETRGNCYNINISRLNISGFENVLLFFQTRAEPTEFDIQEIQDDILRQEKPAMPSLILCFNRSEILMKLVRKRFLNIVLLEEKEIKKLALSPHPSLEFQHDILIRQVKPSSISPYQTEGPVSASFYGRHAEIAKVLAAKDRNFAIVGARRIGKTSLAFKISSHLPTNTIPIYMDLEIPLEQTYDSFLKIFHDKIQEKAKIDFDSPSTLSDLPLMVKQVKEKTGRIPIFFLDEIDSLLKHDIANDYNLLKTFRILSQEGYCQVILSGFSELYHAEQQLESPLYNLCELIPLRQLKREEALSLISEPMHSIGVNFDNETDKDLILKYTSCHPNLIQFFCKRLIEKIEEHETESKRRTIFREDIENLCHSDEYEKYVINNFYLFFTEDVDPVQRVMVLLLLHHYPDQDTFSKPQIMQVLKNNGINIPMGKLTRQLANLDLRYIFSGEKGGKYRFALPIFPEILKRREDIPELIKEILDDAKQSL
ncbi:AAA family ATPase [candidate division KSB1 bacterium]|nr:AAA family ATPase [candidate division KSB1 bacterium]